MGSVEELSRHEVKYAVRTDQLAALRSIMRPFCVPDGYYPPAKNGWYSVDTLYFDSPDLKLYRASENQELVRVKLRTRTYPDSPGSVVKIELKRRIAEKVLKTSTIVAGENWQRWFQPNAKVTQDSLQDFLTLQRTLHAQPKMLIRYQRQAFTSILDDYVRITFDRQVCCQTMERYEMNADSRRWHYVDDEASIGMRGHLLMEVKFKQRPPIWVADMVARLGLIRQGYSKYCCGMRRKQSDWHAAWDMVPA